MSEELFSVGESLSPKLRWIRANRVTTFLSMPQDKDARIWWAGFNKQNKEPAQFFIDEMEANGMMFVGEGNTEEEAICDLCDKTGTPHYTLEQ